MTYVGGAREAGCVFCNALASDDDTATLIIHRGEHAYVILNLYPYNTGHLMVVPNDHVNDPAALSAPARAEMAELTASFCTGLRLVMGCAGLNSGMNLGSAAGAGIAEHLHQHIVPRWTGDANFMPIIGGTKVLPELLPATYGKLRTEVARQRGGAESVIVVALAPDPYRILLSGEALPRVSLEANLPAWQSALTAIAPFAKRSEILGWAGPRSSRLDDDDVPALAVSFDPGGSLDEPFRFIDPRGARTRLDAHDRSLVEQALMRFG